MELYSDFMPITESVYRPRPAVQKLVLTNFRNIALMRIETMAQFIILSGANGAGKTSLLEAISLLAPGRGLRHARIEDMRRTAIKSHDSLNHPHSFSSSPWTSSSWAISAHLDLEGGPVSIGTNLECRDVNKSARRMIHIDKTPMRDQHKLQDYLTILWLTPAMDSLFRSGASERRSFLDRLVKTLEPGHGQQLTAYERVMRERAALLAQGRFDPTWLSTIETNMAAHGVAVAAARCALIKCLNQTEQRYSHFPKPVLRISGFLEEALEKTPALDVEDTYRMRLAHERAGDAARGMTQTGVHRSDMEAYHHGLPASLCSNGEQKAFLIAIILAQARILDQEQKRPPILLLDEIFAHLDDHHQHALADEIHALRGQNWISDSRDIQSLFPRNRTDMLTLREGCCLHSLPVKDKVINE